MRTTRWCLVLLAVLWTASSALAGEKVSKGCRIKGISLWGKVQVVEHFPDLKVQVVQHFPDLKVQKVRNFPDKCGEWEFVDNFPDFKIQLVDHFPDLKIEYVEHFPGLP